jgi:phosphoglycolate phosphatase
MLIIKMLKPDSLIFDLDGTLWDALDTYLESWNEGAKIENLNRVFTRDDLHYVMGWERSKVLSHFFPEMDEEGRERVYKTNKRVQTKTDARTGRSDV